MRFQARFANGYWQLFDRDNFCAVDTFPLKANALTACFFANETGEWRRSGWAARPWAPTP
jgi:hypothetical protein